MKPILFLDVDGVLLDFESSFIEFFREKHPELVPQDYEWLHWNLEIDFPNIDIQAMAMEHLKSDMFGKMKSLVGRYEYNYMIASGLVTFIHLITNIPKWAIDKRYKNLDHHGTRFTTLNRGGYYKFGEEDYPTKIETIKIQIEALHENDERFMFLDDSQHNCVDIKEAFPSFEVYLMSRPHNKNVSKDSRFTRVKNWEAFVEYI